MRLLIVVPGAETKTPKMFDFLFNFYFRFFGVDPNQTDWPGNLIKYLVSKETKIKLFNWSGGISESWSIKPAADHLIRYLRQNAPDYDEVVIFSKSLGGRIVDLALQKTRPDNLSRLIYVATLHKDLTKVRYKDVRIFNIYSKEDNYINFANWMLYLGLGSVNLKQAENIIIPKFRHSDFNKNLLINYHGSQVYLFDLYKSLIFPNR